MTAILPAKSFMRRGPSQGSCLGSAAHPHISAVQRSEFL
jgi:hypothetical protein